MDLKSGFESAAHRDRITEGSRWYSLDECSEDIAQAAEKLDDDLFPRFLTENHTKGQFEELVQLFKEDHVVFLDDSGEQVLATGFSAPVHLGKQLPGNGWEGVVNQIVLDHKKGIEPDTLVAFSASVSPEARGQHMGDKLLLAFRQRAQELGLTRIIVPARPSNKGNYPNLSMDEYITLSDDKTGNHIDPWIRAHQRHGGKIMGIGKKSHVVRSSDGSWPSIEQWQKWTGMTFNGDGDYDIPRGNAKLHVHDGVGEYSEDCIWIVYDLTDASHENS